MYGTGNHARYEIAVFVRQKPQPVAVPATWDDNMKRRKPEKFSLNRRRFVSAAAMTIAGAQLAMYGCARSNNATESSSERNPSVAKVQQPTGSGTTAIRPFPNIERSGGGTRRFAPAHQSDAVASHVNSSRPVARRAVGDDAGARATIGGSDYDWRKCEAKLNAIPQFITEIDGQDIHFIHVRSKHENALPLIITHGWPGSIIEQMKVIAPLTDPTAHGASAVGRIPSRHSVDAGTRILAGADGAGLGSRAHRKGLGSC